MFKFKDITVYTEQDLANTDESYTARIPGTPFCLRAYTAKCKIYDLYLKTYDTAVPQRWFDQYCERHERHPDAVWSYDRNTIFGEPVFWEDVFRQFGHDLNTYVAEHSIATLEAECNT